MSWLRNCFYRKSEAEARLRSLQQRNQAAAMKMREEVKDRTKWDYNWDKYE